MATLQQRESIYRNKIIDKFNNEDFKIIGFQGSRKPVQIKCLKCGNTKNYSRPENIFYKKQYLCDCEKPKGIVLKDAGQKLKNEYETWFKTKGHLKYEEIKGFSRVGLKVVLRCLKCGAVQNRDPRTLIIDGKDGCLCCELHHSIKKTQKQFENDVFELYQGEYIPVSEYKGAREPILMRHSLCGKIFSVKPINFLQRKGQCPICKKSNGERIISELLNKYNIKFQEQFRLEEMKKAPFDFKLIDYPILIEFQGRQHFEPVEKFGGKPQLEVQKEIDARKKFFAGKNNFKIVYFTYKELKQLDKILVQRLSQEGVEFSNSKSLESQVD